LSTLDSVGKPLAHYIKEMYALPHARFLSKFYLGATSHHSSQQGYSHAGKDTSNKGIYDP